MDKLEGLKPELAAFVKRGLPCSLTVHAAMGTELKRLRASLKDAGFIIRPDGKGLELGEATIRAGRGSIVVTLYGNADSISQALSIDGVDLTSAEKTTGYVSSGRIGGAW